MGDDLVESGEVYYCADFGGPDGADYDVDFYLAKKDKKSEVVDWLIHKAGGEDRIRPPKGVAAVDKETARVIGSAIADWWKEPMELNDPRRDKKSDARVRPCPRGREGLGGWNSFSLRRRSGCRRRFIRYRHLCRTEKGGTYEIVETLIHKRDGVERLR